MNRAVDRAVAGVIGTDSLLVLIAVGASGDGAEEEVLSLSALAGHADREGAVGVAEDAVGAAACDAGDVDGRGRMGFCGHKTKDGGKADEE